MQLATKQVKSQPLAFQTFGEKGVFMGGGLENTSRDLESKIFFKLSVTL